MATQEMATHGATLWASIGFAAVGLILLVVGVALFASHLAIAGYGIWIFVWGLAFLVGAFSRYAEARG